jgi:hypothetical protein
MSLKKIGVIAAGAVAVGGLALGGSSIASAATPTPTASASPGAGGGRGEHTTVTGDEAAKVTIALKAKDSAVSVTRVLKDADGSYDVVGTKAGATVKFDVSADLKTITEGKGGHSGGGRGGANDTPATSDEAAKVTAALKAKDATVTVTSVNKDPDGSYDVFGTKAGATVKFDVSADLKTITEGRGGHGRGGRGAKPAPSASSATN